MTETEVSEGEGLSSIPIGEVLGPVLIGVGINAFFYGFTVLQFVQYRTRLFRDSLGTQALVTWTFIVDTVHTISLSWMIWQYTVENFGDVASVTDAPWPFTATPSFLAATAAPIQLFFAFRVWTLSKSPVLVGAIVTLSVANTILGVIATIFAFTHADVHDFKSLLPIIDSWLALGMGCDGLISGTLMYYLTRSRSGFRRHDTFSNRVAHAIVESSILSALFALADLIVYSAVPNTNFHIILGIPMGRVYTCTLLAMLNNRLKLKEDEADGIISNESGRSYERRLEFASAFNNLKRSPTQVRVSVSIKEEVEEIPSLSRSGSLSKAGLSTSNSEQDADTVTDRKCAHFLA